MHRPSAPPACARRRFVHGLLAGTVLACSARVGAAGPARPVPAALSLDGIGFLHRWSGGDQHEFTPEPDADLSRWTDMLTLNVHAAAGTGEALAEVANAVLARYRDHGKVLRTHSVARTSVRPAEHLMVAVLGRPQFLEAAFARFVLHEGAGLVVVRSHRVHGTAVGPEMSRWLAAHGARTEQALMGWNPLPRLSLLAALPR